MKFMTYICNELQKTSSLETNLLNIFTEVYLKIPNWTDYVLLSLAILFLGFSAFFSSAEVAYFSMSQEDLNEFDNSDLKKDKAVLKLLNSPQKLLATIIIGSNVVNIAYIILSVYVLGF